jgi:hypothetical protein
LPWRQCLAFGTVFRAGPVDGRKLTLEEERQRGREAWLAYREREMKGFPDREEEQKKKREHQRDYGLGLGDD